MRYTPVIVAVLRNVSNPRESLIPALLDNLEVSHLDARYREVRDLELHRDRRALVHRVVLCVRSVSCGEHAGFRDARTTADAREPKVCAHEELAPAAELLDLPDEGGLVGDV